MTKLLALTSLFKIIYQNLIFCIISMLSNLLKLVYGPSMVNLVRYHIVNNFSIVKFVDASFITQQMWSLLVNGLYSLEINMDILKNSAVKAPLAVMYVIFLDHFKMSFWFLIVLLWYVLILLSLLGLWMGDNLHSTPPIVPYEQQ